MRRFLALLTVASAVVLISVGLAGADDVEREEIVGTFEGQGALFDGIIEDEGAFTGVADPATSTAVWTFRDDDDDDDDDDDEGTLSNQTTLFEIDLLNPDPATGRFPYTQTIEFTEGTGDFEDVIGGEASIVGTIDIFSFQYDGVIDGYVIEDD